MRLMTRRAAGLDSGDWDLDAKEAVIDVFDTLAPEWHTRTSRKRTEVVVDAFTRGLDAIGGGWNLAIEVGARVSAYTDLLSQRFGAVLSLDLSFEMIARSRARAAYRLVADASQLPVHDGSADCVALINAFVFPEEVKRILKGGGTIVRVNSSGEQTPIHLPTNDLVKALPFRVRGVESRAGAGTWCVLVRAG